MNVKVITTRRCSHRPNLERELKVLGVAYELVFIEDQPELVWSMDIRHSPSLAIDGEVVFREQPEGAELRACFSETR